MKLTVTFAGLFVFVEHDGMVKALLPRTYKHASRTGAPSGRHGMPVHVALLYWATSTGAIACLPIGGSILRVEAPGSPVDATNTPDVFNLSQVTGRPVRRETLGDEGLMDAALHARVDLAVPWQQVQVDTADYEFPDPPGPKDPVPMAIWWQYSADVDALPRLTLTHIEAGARRREFLPASLTFGSVDEVHLGILHMPGSEFPGYDPPPGQSGDPVEHFDAYYDLFELGGLELPKPTIHSPRTSPPVNALVRRMLGGGTNTCPSLTGNPPPPTQA